MDWHNQGRSSMSGRIHCFQQVHEDFVKSNTFPLSYVVVYMALHATSAAGMSTRTPERTIALTDVALVPGVPFEVLVSIPVSLLCCLGLESSC